MSKFKKDDGGKSAPGISTASLPDVVFMVLFFFMVTTVMRETNLELDVNRPEADAISKLEKKSLVDYIYIGKSITPEKHGTGERIQIDDQIINSASQVGPLIAAKQLKRDETERPYITVSLKVDEKTEMGIVTRVKHELREVDALKISYSTGKKTVKVNQ
ncbi:MAG: ExbD/TolR family protein [Bacteroidota bacterium]